MGEWFRKMTHLIMLPSGVYSVQILMSARVRRMAAVTRAPTQMARSHVPVLQASACPQMIVLAKVITCLIHTYGAIQVLRNADGVGGVKFSGKKRYEGVRFNVISVTRGWVGV